MRGGLRELERDSDVECIWTERIVVLACRLLLVRRRYASLTDCYLPPPGQLEVVHAECAARASAPCAAFTILK